MPDHAIFEHEFEQMRIALAQILIEELDLNVREALELADHFYGEIAPSVETGAGVWAGIAGNASTRG